MPIKFVTAGSLIANCRLSAADNVGFGLGVHLVFHDVKGLLEQRLDSLGRVLQHSFGSRRNLRAPKREWDAASDRLAGGWDNA